MAAEIKVRAERRLGEMLCEQKAAGGMNVGTAGMGRPHIGGSERELPNSPTLAEVGIDKKLSMRAQQLAAMPEQHFETAIASAKETARAANFATGAAVALLRACRMAVSKFLQFERLAEAVGPGAALSLVAFYDGLPTVYVPGIYRPGHLLERVLGEAGFLRMVAAFGGETVCLPRARLEAERRAGAVYRGMRNGLSTAAIADQTGITRRRVRQIETAIKGGEPLTAAARRN
jgi:hypothetical protein